MSNPEPTIGFYADSVGAGLATLIKVAAGSPGKVTVFARRDIGRRLVDHEMIFPFLASLPTVELRDHADASGLRFDVLYATWSHSGCFTRDDRERLRSIFPGAGRRVLLYDAYFGDSWDLLKQQARTLASEIGWMRHADEICYMTVYPRCDLFSLKLNWKRYPLSVGPNIDLLYDDEKLAQLDARWDPEEVRPLSLMCTGNKGTSQWRTALVEYLEERLEEPLGVELVEREPANANRRAKPVLWSFKGVRPSLARYTELLSRSDFVVCIPGTSWTHRPFEALVRGAVPIVDEFNLRVHDVPWKDGENCLIVRRPQRKESWLATIASALSLRGDQVIAMRRNILALQETHLSSGAFSSRLLRKIGLTGPKTEPTATLAIAS